jgi:asparagine synthase (glutamine-hydrolysing)
MSEEAIHHRKPGTQRFHWRHVEVEDGSDSAHVVTRRGLTARGCSLPSAIGSAFHPEPNGSHPEANVSRVCGITGKVSLRSAVDPALLEQMCFVIEHRGPDSRGMYVKDGVGLGIQRLRVIDLETGDQPIYNENEGIVVVLNGEIYNYRELRAELVGRGHRFSTHGDTEVIVHLYEEHGPDCVRFLRGMFAFALWDDRRRRLLLGRDRVGKKPLFYYERDGELWFGSEAKAILQDPAVPREPDYAAIDSYLQYQYVPHPLSAFAGMRKLPPAHTLVWEQGQSKVTRYWQLSYRVADPLPSVDEAHERIRELILEATRLRLRSDVPIGAFLSGGVDSSAVVAAMAMQSTQPVKTFSIGFDVASYDETAFAREVAELFETDHQELRVHPEAMEVLPRLVWHYGEPFADHSAIPSFYLAELTRRHVTVALNGDGGDESFAGYRRYVGASVAARLAGFPAPVRTTISAAARILGDGPKADSFRTRLTRLANAMQLDMADRYAMWMSIFTEHERAKLYTPDFHERVDMLATAAFIRAPLERSDATDSVNELLDVDVQTYLPGDLLVKMDIATMAHSLEVRSPLLDHELMEFAASLPGSWKISGKTTKKVLKDALRPWLPDHILDRPKLGFGVPIAEWLAGSLSALPRDVLLDDRATERGFFRPDVVERLIDEHVTGERDNSHKLWALIQLELWLQTFVDAHRRAPLALA